GRKRAQTGRGGVRRFRGIARLARDGLGAPVSRARRERGEGIARLSSVGFDGNPGATRRGTSRADAGVAHRCRNRRGEPSFVRAIERRLRRTYLMLDVSVTLTLTSISPGTMGGAPAASATMD